MVYEVRIWRMRPVLREILDRFSSIDDAKEYVRDLIYITGIDMEDVEVYDTEKHEILEPRRINDARDY